MAGAGIINTNQVVYRPRVVVVGLASCFGCQLQITNIESHLMELLGQIDLTYWQLASSDPMPQYFDVAIIEGAVTTQESVETVRTLRRKADTLIAIGACATTGGIPGMAGGSLGLADRAAEVYEKGSLPEACGEMCVPRPISSVVKVDAEVRCCPIDSYDFVKTLHRLVYGSNRAQLTSTLCGECKRNETTCFYAEGTLCLGLITRSGCGARCVNLGRPCNGCAGLSPDANVDSARDACVRYGVSVERFDKALEMFNQFELDAVLEQEQAQKAQDKDEATTNQASSEADASDTGSRG